MEIIIILLIAVCVCLMFREWHRTEARISGIEERMHELEAVNRKRMPYKAMEELLDAMAALDKEKSEMQFHVSLIDNARGHMMNAMKSGTVRE